MPHCTCHEDIPAEGLGVQYPVRVDLRQASWLPRRALAATYALLAGAKWGHLATTPGSAALAEAGMILAGRHIMAAAFPRPRVPHAEAALQGGMEPVAAPAFLGGLPSHPRPPLPYSLAYNHTWSHHLHSYQATQLLTVNNQLVTTRKSAHQASTESSAKLSNPRYSAAASASRLASVASPASSVLGEAVPR
jgi:hypothetical protein